MNQNGGIHKGGFAVLCHRNGGSESPGILTNMMALSPEYKAYHDALDKINQRICEDLGLYYDSKFQLVLKNK